MSRIIPEAWLPECEMKRIITHWTAGSYHVSSVDREHYHIIIEGDGRLVRGDYSIRDNLSTGDGAYAAHTRGCNTGSIGVSCAAMAGAMQSPFYGGKYPLTRDQYDSLIQVCADLCEFYDIPVQPTTVLNHGEVEANLGIEQRQKWDINVLPWDRSIVAGAYMRNQIAGARHGAPIGGEAAPVIVEVDGKVVSDEGFVFGGTGFAPLRPIADERGWVITAVDPNNATVMLKHDVERRVAITLRGDRAYVGARSLSIMADWPAPEFIAPSRRLEFLTYGKEVK